MAATAASVATAARVSCAAAAAAVRSAVPMTASKDSFCLSLSFPSLLLARASLFRSSNFEQGEKEAGREGKENDRQLHAFLSFSRAAHFFPPHVINDIIRVTTKTGRTLCIIGPTADRDRTRTGIPCHLACARLQRMSVRLVK